MKTNNRKTVSFTGTINHNGDEYEVNGSKTLGVYLDVIHATIEQLDACISQWGRVFTMRFDLRQKEQTSNSEMLTKFRKNLMRKLVRQYQMRFMGYAWAREKETTKNQHYHMVIFLDGNLIRHSTKLIKIIIETWERVCDGNTIGYARDCFCNITDDKTKADAIYQFSYLAKSRGKGYRPPQAKDYGTSRLRA